MSKSCSRRPATWKTASLAKQCIAWRGGMRNNRQRVYLVMIDHGRFGSTQIMGKSPEKPNRDDSCTCVKDTCGSRKPGVAQPQS